MNSVMGRGVPDPKAKNNPYFSLPRLAAEGKLRARARSRLSLASLFLRKKGLLEAREREVYPLSRSFRLRRTLVNTSL